MLAGLSGPEAHLRWMLSGPLPAILILADDYRREPPATQNELRSPRGCRRPDAQPGTSDGARGSPHRGESSCIACFLRGRDTPGSSRSSYVRALADRVRLRTRGSASGWVPWGSFLCVNFAWPWGAHRRWGEGVTPITLPGYQGGCCACSAALWRVDASVSAALIAAATDCASVVDRVRAAERPGCDVVGFGAVRLQGGAPCERDAAGGACGLSGVAVAFEYCFAPAFVGCGPGAA